MFGLIVLGLLGTYLLLLIGATVWAYRRAAKKGLPRHQRWLWAAGAFLLVYLPVFWDWIPTVVVHRYYCEREAGFWVYKTIDQWKVENPGVAETLVATKGAPSRYEPYDDGHGKKDSYLVNQRFNRVVSQQDISSLLPVIRIEQQVKDVQKNEVLARYVDFATGNSVKYTSGPPGPLKFWLHSAHCVGGAMNGSRLSHFSSEAKHLGEGERK